MGLLDSAGMQRLWARVKSLVQPYIKEVRQDGNQVTFTKGNGEVKSINIAGSSSSNVFVDVMELPTEHIDTNTIYRLWQVTKAEWVLNGELVTDGGMICEVVDTLPEVGNMCYTGTSMYSYYQRSDYNTYGYVDENLSAMMSVPVGWYLAEMLFAALGYTYNGVVPSLKDASKQGYYLLIALEPSFYVYSQITQEYIKTKITTDDIPNIGGSGDSSIIDLGEQGDHKDAQSQMIDYINGNVNGEDYGCYLFKYWCGCSETSCFAITFKGYGFIEGTVYNNSRKFRRFYYDCEQGDYIEDGCWEQVASANSGGATLSMPRIRLSNWYYGEIPVFDDIEEDGLVSGKIVFSVNVQDGIVQEGDQLQVCAIRSVFGKKKLRPILSRYITNEDIENLAKQPYLQISTDDMAGNNLSYSICEVLKSFYRTDSAEKGKPKYIRIRRPVWGTNRDGEEVEVSASFSNAEPVYINLRYVFLSEQSSESEE